MALKNFNVSGKMLFTWLLLSGGILLFTPESITGKLQLAFARVFRWPLTAGRNVAPLASTSKKPISDYVTRQEYDQLQIHLNNVIEQLYQKKQEVEMLSQLRKLKGLENRSALQGAALITASIINSNINNTHNELIINRGSDDGLELGQFVLANNSIIGRICEVSNRTARVKMISDLASTIPVTIATNSGSHIDAILKGKGNYQAKIDLLPVKNKVQAGEKVYAAKHPGFLDTPILLGTIKKCQRLDENPLLWDILVTPACSIENITDIAIVIMNPKP